LDTSDRKTCRIDESGSLVITDLPTPAEGKILLKRDGLTVERDISAVAGADHRYAVDFSHEVDLRIAVPEQLAAGQDGEAVLTIRNAGRAAVDLELRLSASGVTLSEERLNLSVAPDERVVKQVKFTAGEKVTPYLIRAYVRKGAPASEWFVAGRIGERDSNAK